MVRDRATGERGRRRDEHDKAFQALDKIQGLPQGAADGIESTLTVSDSIWLTDVDAG